MNKTKKYYYFGWTVILITMIFMHCFRLGDIPYGINVDEMGMGYDAWCLSHFGTDRYLNSFPVYLINFSGGQSALYAYLCAPFVYFFGISATVLRIPAAIFSFITLIFLVKIVNLLFENSYLNLLTGAIYVISPVFTMLSRIGLDCNLMLGMSAVFMYFFIKACKTGMKRDNILSGIFGGILLYSYVLSHIAMPAFLLLAIIYMIWTKKAELKNIVCMGIPVFILALPLMLFHYINMFGLDELHIGMFTIPKLYLYRSGDLSWECIKDNISLFFKYTLCNDYVRFNSVEGYYNMYFVSIPFIIIGFGHDVYKLAVSFKKREWDSYVLFVFWAVIIFLVGIFLGSGGPTVYRVNALFAAYLVFNIDGIYFVYKLITKYKVQVAKIFVGIVAVLYLGSFVLFERYYFTKYTQDTYMIDLFDFTFQNVLDYMEEDMPENVKYRTIYVGPGNQTYIYYLGGSYTSPYDYNVLADDKPYTLWQWTQSYKNYRFYFPEEIDPLGNYIVPEVASECIDLLEQYGFSKEHVGTFYLFWNDMVEQKQSNAEAVTSWDHGVNNGVICMESGDSTTVSGWSINSTVGKVWDDAFIEISGKYYAADKMDREDVASNMGSDLFLKCGIHFTIDNETLKQADSARIVFVNYHERSCFIDNMIIDSSLVDNN